MHAQPPFTAFGAAATTGHESGIKPLPFHLPSTMNMTTTDAQLEERRRAAIREREREAAAKERNRQLLAKRREDQLRLKNQVEEEAKARETLMKDTEQKRLAQIEAVRLAKLKEKEDEEVRRRAKISMNHMGMATNFHAATGALCSARVRRSGGALPPSS